MHIAIAGPVSCDKLEKYLGAGQPIPAGMGGISVTELAAGLIEAGHTVSIISLDFGVAPMTVIRGPRATAWFGTFRERHGMRDLKSVERHSVSDCIRACGAQIVSAHWTYEYALGAIEARIPTLITVRDWAPAVLRLKWDLYRAGRAFMQYLCLRRGHHFCANSPYIQERVEAALQVPVVMIPNSISDAMFSPAPRTRAVNRNSIVSVSNGFGALKNLKVLLRAFAKIRMRIPDATLALVGIDLGSGGSAQRWAEENTLAEGVHFVGPLPHPAVVSLVGSADLMIHPSLEESFGLTLIEAMSQRTPVIGGCRSGAVPWVLDNGKAGVLVDVRDPDAIASGAIDILTDRNRWNVFSSAGYIRAKANFSGSVVTDKYLAAYERILSAPLETEARQSFRGGAIRVALEMIRKYDPDPAYFNEY